MIILYLQKYGLISSKIIMSFSNMFLRTGGHTYICMSLKTLKYTSWILKFVDDSPATKCQQLSARVTVCESSSRWNPRDNWPEFHDCLPFYQVPWVRFLFFVTVHIASVTIWPDTNFTLHLNVPWIRRRIPYKCNITQSSRFWVKWQSALV